MHYSCDEVETAIGRLDLTLMLSPRTSQQAWGKMISEASADNFGLPSPDSVIKCRSGNVLHRGMIMKSDHFPGCQVIVVDDEVCKTRSSRSRAGECCERHGNEEFRQSLDRRERRGYFERDVVREVVRERGGRGHFERERERERKRKRGLCWCKK